MSLINNDMYEKVVPEEIIGSDSLSGNESLVKLTMLPKSDHTEDISVYGHDAVMDEDADAKVVEHQEAANKDEETTDILSKVMETPSESEPEYMEHSQSLSSECMEKDEWNLEDGNTETSMLTKVQTSAKSDLPESQSDDQAGDEETIATFVTAAGQQLALYAVENSEEIFAVAVYDESGAPPTNFQFLMKADVERLIGQGAVRTVKKPTQIKKQLLAAQPSIFFSKTESMNVLNHEGRCSVAHQRVPRNSWSQSANLLQESDMSANMKEIPDIIYTNTTENSKDIAYLMMDDSSESDQSSSPEEEEGEEEEEEEEEEEDDNDDDDDDEVELLEQSTVQYILFETDESESELTFDEVEATLQNFKSYDRQMAVKKSPPKKVLRNQNDHVNEKRPPNEYQRNNHCRILNHKIDTIAQQKFMADRQELLDTLEDTPTSSVTNDANQSLTNRSLDCTLPETAQVQLRTKRSRKQQLVSVNRDDSEIIIQPALLVNEEENNLKKQTKRRRKVVSDYHRSSEPKRIKRLKRKEVEIIEIDVDEDERGSQSKKDVVEITLEDSKDKYSSDKENEIIMVGDSEDELQQSDARTTVLQCQHCSRTFRQQRALDTHLRVCSKSPANTTKLNEQKAKSVNRTNNEVKKQYACKICQEKFDVVVALARHVRSQHSQRKKRRYSKSLLETATAFDSELAEESEKDNEKEIEKEQVKQSETESQKDKEKEKVKIEPRRNRSSTETKATNLRTINRVKTKRRSQRTNRSWESKKLSCSDCGRWFPSAALLRAHYLQHETKRSEQQVRRCQICKKLIKSRLLYIRHLKMHNTTQQNIKNATSLQKKLHATRPATRKITSLRKRGRGRKL